MLASLRTFSLLGIDAIPVDVEVDVATGGLPKTILVGLPEAAVRESTHRVPGQFRISTPTAPGGDQPGPRGVAQACGVL